MRMQFTGGFEIFVAVFALFMVFVLFTAMWIYERPSITKFLVSEGLKNSTSQTAAVPELITADQFFYHAGDSIATFIYFALIFALFIRAIYEGADPAVLPLGLLILIPLIIVTFPLADAAHSFASQSLLKGAANYYSSTLYLLENAPIITAVVSLIYLIFLGMRRTARNPMMSGANVFRN